MIQTLANLEVKYTAPIPCWHVYRQSVLVIDGKNNNDDGRFTNRVYMARTKPTTTKEQATKTQKNKVEKLRRNSTDRCTQSASGHQGRGEFHYQISGEIAFPEMTDEVQVIKACRRIKGCGL
jgi:hypothetical protein